MLLLHFPKGLPLSKAPPPPTLLLDLYGREGRKYTIYQAMNVTAQLYQVQAFLDEDWLRSVRMSIIEVLEKECNIGVEEFESRDDDEVFLKVWAADAILLRQAEATFYKLKLKPELEPLQEYKEYTPFLPYSEAHSSIFETYDGKLLQDTDRIHLLDAIIRDHLNIVQALHHKVLIDYFPLHNEDELKKLKSHVLSSHLKFKEVPAQELRNYMGEELTYYLLWLNYFNKWLSLLAFVGLVLFVVEHVFGSRVNDDKIGVYEWGEVIFAIIACVWTAAYQVSWRRKAFESSVKFGTQDADEDELVRHEFQGVSRINPITDQPELYFPSKQRYWRQVVSYTSTALMISLALAATIGIFLYKATAKQAGKWVGVLSAVQVISFSIIYNKLALKLNDWENHKTETEFKNHLVVKKVCFQLINYYASPFYIAFFKDHIEGCIDDDCMLELNSHLWGMFVFNLFFNIFELAQPFLSTKLRLYFESRKVIEMKMSGSNVRLEIGYDEMQGKLASISYTEEYSEIVLNYGYTIFFCVAFPLGPAIYWFYNWLEIYTDSFKFFRLSKRPFPRKAQNIGSWDDIMHFLSVVAIVTNTALIFFTANLFNLKKSAKWKEFVVLEHILILVFILILAYTPRARERK
mmetsp:Transcript_23406/g.41527  ORF Transcript_23406/g.41527 Transcript_23406/m.41527 type:complete len:633 (-) Transcript_23406:166-2064(-)